MCSFFRICILRLQKVLLWPKKFFSLKNINMGIKNTQQKLKAKNHEKMHKNEKTQNSHSFLALAFFRGICLSRHQRIWNQHKILRVFDTHIDIFPEKIFLGHISTFCNLKMQMRKKLYIFKNFAKSKKLIFCQYLSISVWFLLKFQKKYKIEAPYWLHSGAVANTPR